MTDVISYRTDRIEDLKKLSKEKNTSLSQISSEIIEEYLEFKNLKKQYRMHSESEKLISYVFKFLDESSLEKVIDMAADEAIRAFKISTNDFSLTNLIGLTKNWFELNDISFETYDDEFGLKLVSKNNMSENWNLMHSKGWIKIFEHFGFLGKEDYVSEGMFSIKISKQKS